MEGEDLLSVSSVDQKLPKVEILKRLITEKLTTAAREILAVVERTVSGYEEEAAGLRTEIDRQRSQLEAVLQPRVSLCRMTDGGEDLGHSEDEGSVKTGVINLHVGLLQDSHPRFLSRNVVQSEVQEVRCPRGLKEEEFLDLLKTTFPQLSREVEIFSVDASGKLKTLDLRDLTPEEIQSSGGSVLYIREKAADDSVKNPTKEDATTNNDNNGGPSLKTPGRRRTSLNLRVCLLKDSETNVLKRGVLRSQVQEVRCPRGLQEPQFLDLLRSSFPQLTGLFDAFTVDTTKKLTPLNLKTLTPEKIQRAIQSRGKGRSALYIRAKDSRSFMEKPPPSDGRAEAVDESSPDGRVEELLQHVGATEDGVEHDGRSQDFRDPNSARHGADSDDGDDGDEEWKPDENCEETEEMKKKKKIRSSVRTKRRKPKLSSLKVETSGAPLSCRVCRALRGSENMLIKHSWSHVDDPEGLCGVCGEHSEDLRSHLNAHQKTHSCDVCGKTFLSLVGLQRHVPLHSREKPFECQTCGKVYVSRSSLRNHQWEHVENKRHGCDVCHRSFAFKQQLRIHSRTHTGEKPFTCDVCGKSVSDLNSLSRHNLIHAGEKRYGCRFCGKRFLTPGKVREHEKIHTVRDRRYLCEICCKTFHTQGELNAHLRTHSQDKIMCGVCGKGLSSKGALRRHAFIHTGEKPYECSVCGRSFNSSSLLRNHLKTHSGVKPFVCSICGKASSRKEHLIVHMRTHNGEKPYRCTVCDRGFTQSHCLKTHMKSHQGAAEEEERAAAGGQTD
ncbi:zinc finger protein 37-like isoform X1 [Xyrichtys novacula]|uniref:Zinc finger protein 37-like isoform X1 n=1 Tax=Xyrichtys novacula TaxID=13765 RepID=A0AAV1EHW7_XYRNO|nr:zinc finger protein 37-like isoform X1 [Xyrichtys novacula]